jgi:Bacteriocin-protection, YdeI or OmpD-Associated
MPIFTARIRQVGLLYGVKVPAAAVKALGSARRIPVIARYAWGVHASTVTTDRAGGGRLFLRVDVFRPHGLGVGDKVAITLTRDQGSRELPLPPDLQRAFQFRPAAAAAFARAAPSTRRITVALLEESRTPETRQRRLEKLVERLAENTADRATKI